MKYLKLYESEQYKGKRLYPFHSTLSILSDDELEYYWLINPGDVMMGLQNSFTGKFNNFEEKKNIQKNYIDPILKRIINTFDVNTKSKEFKRVPLIPALHLGYLEVVKELLRNGADITIKDGYGDDPLNAGGINKDYWKLYDIQDLILKHQPENWKLLDIEFGILPEIKKKYNWVFDMDDIGLF
jgi:hypothetical protein